MYNGSYVNDHKHGWGVYRWADGRVYIGTWTNGQQDNERVYILPNGEMKKATWENGKKGAYEVISEEDKAWYLQRYQQAVEEANNVESHKRSLIVQLEKRDQ